MFPYPFNDIFQDFRIDCFLTAYSANVPFFIKSETDDLSSDRLLDCYIFVSISGDSFLNGSKIHGGIHLNILFSVRPEPDILVSSNPGPGHISQNEDTTVIELICADSCWMVFRSFNCSGDSVFCNVCIQFFLQLLGSFVCLLQYGISVPCGRLHPCQTASGIPWDLEINSTCFSIRLSPLTPAPANETTNAMDGSFCNDRSQ